MVQYNKELINIAKTLRKNMTKQEKHLWYDFLSGYKYKFVKQKVIGNYIVDFYCHEAKIVIELDGSQHYSENGLEYDRFRTKDIEELGIKVIRFYNKEIDNNFEEVCKFIEKKIENRIKETTEPFRRLRRHLPCKGRLI